MIWYEAATLPETLAVAEEVKQDLAQWKPNVVLDAMQDWIPGLISFGCRLLVAAVILFLGIRIAGMVRKMLGRTFRRMEMEISLSKFLLSMTYAIICGLAVFAAADKIGISSASILAVLGSAGLALGLALQGSLSNFAGGVLILLMKPFKVGDYIICNGNEGTVATIGLVY
ncbi:MAG: mechanosensitive ion channel, partial [Hungatella sp.]